MAAPTVKEILLRWGIDNSNWKKAITELSQMLDKANKDSAKAQDAAVKKLGEQKAKLKEIIADQKSATAEIEKQIAALKVKAASANAEKATAAAKLVTERAASAEGQKQAVIQKNLQLIQKTIQQEVYTKLMNERLVTAEINRQTAALRQQATAARLAAAGGAGGGVRRPPGGGGGGGGFGIGSMLGRLFGGGLFGTVTAAVASAEGLEAALSRVIDKVKELAQETGPLQQVREQFEKLAAGRGIQDSAAFIDKLRGATRGLVDDLQLYRTANTFFQSSVHASEQDIIKLTEATVGLARAQGKDATAATQALTQYFLTGYPRALAKVLGVQRAYLSQTGQMSKGMDQAGKAQLSFNQLLEVATKQYEAIGTPALTYAEHIKQIEVATHRFFEEFMLGVQKSTGFEYFLKFLDDVLAKMNKLADGAEAFGEKFGGVFVVVTEFFKTVMSIAESLWAMWEGLVDLVKAVFVPENIGDDFTARLTTINGLLRTMAELLILVRGVLGEFGLRAEYTFKEAAVSAKEFVHWLATGVHELGKVKEEQAKLHKEFLEKMDQAQFYQKTLDDITKVEETFGKKGLEKSFKIKIAAPAELYTEEMEEAAARKIAKVKEQIAIESAKIQLEQTKMRIASETELVKMQYEQGLMSHKEYLEKIAVLDKEDHEAKLKQIKDEYAATAEFNRIDSSMALEMAKMKKIQAELSYKAYTDNLKKQRDEAAKNITESTVSPAEKAKAFEDLTKQTAFYENLAAQNRAAAIKVADAEVAEIKAKAVLDLKKSMLETDKEADAYARKGRQRTEEELNDEIKARQKLADAEKRIAQERIARNREVLEKEFQEGLVSSNDYLAARVQAINDEFTATQQAAEKKRDQNKLTLVAAAEFDATMVEASSKREKEITQLTDQEWDIRIKAAEHAADRVKSVLESQLRLSEELTKIDPFGGRAEQTQILNNLISLEEKRLKILTEEARQTKDLPETWTKVAEEINKTQANILKYNEQLLKSRDYSTELANQAKSMSAVVSLFPRGGKTAAGLEDFARLTETISKPLQAFRERMLAQAGGKIAPKTPEEVYAALEAESTRAGNVLGKAAQDSANELGKWTSAGDTMQKALSASIDSQTSAIEQQVMAQGQLITSTQAASSALDGLAARAAGKTGSGRSYNSGVARLPSGQKTAGAPGGSLTMSDIQAMEADFRSSGGGTALTSGGGPAESMSMFASASTMATSSVTKLSTSMGSFAQSLLQNTLGQSGLIGAFKNIRKNTDEAAKDLGNFASGVTAIVGMIGGAYQALHTTGAVQGAFAGAAAGGQIGQAFFGPIGGAIGSAVGAIAGAISGSMRAATERLAIRLEATFKAIQVEVQQGNQTLSAGIQLSITQIQTTVSSLSGKKGGRDQLKKILPDMEAQLQQLQAQQQSVLKSMDAQLNVLNAPQAYQESLNSIDAIIQKYRDYIQAGGSVINANQFLQDSFKQLAQQGINQLNQDEQDAINNALHYNDLLLQRQNLIQDTNQQIQDIMSQGVAVRQMPAGVTKARQIQELMRGATQQMDQLNEEIAVSQHKLVNEQKIFNLATTRIGLENQLVILQNQQTDLSLQQIEALGNVVGALQQKLPTSVQAALQQLGLGPAYVSPGTERGLAPVPPVKTGVQAIDLENQLIYQQQLAAWQLAQNQPIGYIPTTGTVTTTPVPVSIGKGVTGSSMPPGQVWLGPNYVPPTPTAGGTSFLTGGGSIPIGPLGTTVPGLTVNNEQVETVSTSAGTALLVSVADITGPGTVQQVGIVPGAQKLGSSIWSLFNSLSGANPNLLANAPSPGVGAGTGGGLPSWLTGSSPWVWPSLIKKYLGGTPKAPSSYPDIGTQPGPVSEMIGVTSSRAAVEQQINSLSTIRISNETQLVSLKMQEIAMDMQRIQAHSDMIRAFKGGALRGYPGPTLEDLMQTTYETRGRQGFGRFYGEIANPT